VNKIDPTFHAVDNGIVLKAALKAMAAHEGEACREGAALHRHARRGRRKWAEVFPEFNVILCQIEGRTAAVPTRSTTARPSSSRSVTRDSNVASSASSREQRDQALYQLVPLGEEYMTPKEKVAAHPSLPSWKVFRSGDESESDGAVHREAGAARGR